MSVRLLVNAAALQSFDIFPLSVFHFAQVEAETMSEVDLAKIFRHMLLGVSHTHVSDSDLRNLEHIIMGRTAFFQPLS